ncbi:1-hydroxycarotenoid 3,4-desaturase CrtD [Daejeonella oryzae]|uniref:1-hydroxycarotenoid 3,4-desaturase CrtD n=1 Tax=Daejeonella oryzae TaxID=1122943 RepID=UPI000426C381|nr:1-hydroxycarotenoid 3,4-desaturase CrtD [Daejeonella oryzae]
MPDAIIIGAGIAGIASSIRLAVKGFSVTVFEANEYAGGKLAQIENSGFRFDAGPSLFTMPQYVDELFKLAGKNPSDYFQYEKLEEICRYFYEDGTRISAWSDKYKFAEEIEKKTSDSSSAVLKQLEKSAEIYDITNHIFLEKSLHKLSGYLNLKTLNSIFRFPAIDPFRTMAEANSTQFSDSKTVRLFNRYATYNGSDPYQAPATLNIIPHLEQHFGAYFPHGGMISITRSLVQLAMDVGVKFIYNSPVKEIICEGSQVKGVKVGDKIYHSNLVISNMDVWFTYKHLLKNEISPSGVLNQERSSSALIFYWGIKKQFSELDLHTIFFSEDYKQEFEDIWKNNTISSDPTVYLNISSKYNKKDSPEGCENWFVMINVPSNKGQDWDTLISRARENILNKISANLKTDIRSLIVCEDILDPRSIESKTSSYQGSLYGTSSNNKFAAFLRHSNFSGKVKGLYFAGGSVHPGGGIPLALLSAKIVSGLIK